jgi:hypothetical protein
MDAIDHHGQQANLFFKRQSLIVLGWLHADQLVENAIDDQLIGTKVLTLLFYLVHKHETDDLRPYDLFVVN